VQTHSQSSSSSLPDDELPEGVPEGNADSARVAEASAAVGEAAFEEESPTAPVGEAAFEEESPTATVEAAGSGFGEATAAPDEEIVVGTATASSPVILAVGEELEETATEAIYDGIAAPLPAEEEPDEAPTEAIYDGVAAPLPVAEAEEELEVTVTETASDEVDSPSSPSSPSSSQSSPSSSSPSSPDDDEPLADVPVPDGNAGGGTVAEAEPETEAAAEEPMTTVEEAASDDGVAAPLPVAEDCEEGIEVPVIEMASDDEVAASLPVAEDCEEGVELPDTEAASDDEVPPPLPLEEEPEDCAEELDVTAPEAEVTVGDEAGAVNPEDATLPVAVALAPVYAYAGDKIAGMEDAAKAGAASGPYRTGLFPGRAESVPVTCSSTIGVRPQDPEVSRVKTPMSPQQVASPKAAEVHAHLSRTF
jgi:hypothetical protein